MDSRGFRDGAPRGSDPGMAGRRVYIGNMSYRTTESDIWGFMSRAGDVTGCRIMRLPDGKSKGCALIEYRHPREAEEAIQRLHDLELHGRKVFIREDREPAGPPVSSYAPHVHWTSPCPKLPRLATAPLRHHSRISWLCLRQHSCNACDSTQVPVPFRADLCPGENITVEVALVTAWTTCLTGLATGRELASMAPVDSVG